MCGRYTITRSAAELGEAFEVAQVPEFPPRYNVAPSQSVPVVRLAAGGERRMELLRWGLIPFWARDPGIGYKMINARAETVAEKPSYREAFKRRRCLMVADGFYEWKKAPGGKQPHYFRLKSGESFAFAGLWERWEGEEEIRSCALITTEPNGVVGAVHDRMPVILSPADYEAWLEADDPDLLRSLLRPYPGEEMEGYAVSPAVNSPRNDDPAVIEPVG
jgi:putative SOS response-associated peptidase YedK